MLLFIILTILGSPYESLNYSDPSWSTIKTLWHAFEWVYFGIAPIIVLVLSIIIGIKAKTLRKGNERTLQKPIPNIKKMEKKKIRQK